MSKITTDQNEIAINAATKADAETRAPLTAPMVRFTLNSLNGFTSAKVVVSFSLASSSFSCIVGPDSSSVCAVLP